MCLKVGLHNPFSNISSVVIYFIYFMCKYYFVLKWNTSCSVRSLKIRLSNFILEEGSTWPYLETVVVVVNFVFLCQWYVYEGYDFPSKPAETGHDKIVGVRLYKILISRHEMLSELLLKVQFREQFQLTNAAILLGAVK